MRRRRTDHFQTLHDAYLADRFQIISKSPSSRLIIQVIAHENVPLRFKRYDLTNGYNAHINSIQTQRKTPWPSNFRHPDVTYRDSLTISVGGVRLDLFHARGETDDGTWVYYPDGNAIFTGDLFLWVSPNCGNPQKQQRYPLEWSLALRKMQSLRAEFLFPGHGPPILGAANVNRALDETARFLELILDHTLQGLNAGHRLDAIIGSLSLPTDLLSRPYLRPIYDEPEFVVRNIWRLYGGWYDQNPSNLKPPREGKLAVSIAKLAGSPIALARTAEKEEDTAVAVTLIENAWLAAKELRVEGEEWKEINRIRSGLYLKQAGESTSLMAQSIYKFASGESLREVGV